ncbi:hypothetical protein D3C72_2065720 [compost metagenome]
MLSSSDPPLVFGSAAITLAASVGAPAPMPPTGCDGVGVSGVTAAGCAAHAAPI